MKQCFDWNCIDIEKLVTDQKAFNQLIYSTPWDASDELQKRWEDKRLEKQINEYLGGDIPKPLTEGYRSVLFRQLFTPNYELRRFMHVTNSLSLQPLFFEYHDDKFTSINPLKHCLGKMRFRQDMDDNTRVRIRPKTIIDFNNSQGKKIKEVRTVWNQSFIDFHHKLLESVIPNSNNYLFDASDWFHRAGECAKQYYTRYTILFIRNGILFENFILDGVELSFVKEIFLPAFIEAWKITHKKPIIVPLLPRENEKNEYWTAYPIETWRCMEKMKMI